MNKLLQQIVFAAALSWAIAVCGGESCAPGMVKIAGGVYRPFFTTAGEPKEVQIKSFELDILPVTNGDFLKFLRTHPQWRRSHVRRLFADESYLNNWAGDLDPGTNASLNAPVTFVSWFAARAYAQANGKRLPTVAEWEYAAAASPSRPDGENDPEFRKQILEWYSTPSPLKLERAGLGKPNYWGARDMHGLVWEWVADFNTALLTGDGRDGGASRQFFCGAGSQGARDAADFPAFMRYGFRSSLKADYCIHNLGFRCAKDL